MKVIEIPKQIQVRLLTERGPTQTEVLFKEWATNVIDHYGEGVKTLKQVRQVQRIAETMEKANGTIQLEDADYDLLKAAIEAYPTKFPPVIARQHLPFIDAIEAAQEVKK